MDQFLQKSCNNTRTDAYGGSIENRSRFLLQIINEVTSVVGASQVAVRLSPFSDYQDMGMESDLFDLFGYVVGELSKFPLSYISMTDPKNAVGGSPTGKLYSSDYFRAIVRGIAPVSKYFTDSTTVFPEPSPERPTLFLSAGGYACSDVEPIGDRTGDLIGFGRFYIANPDLVYRLKNGLELNGYDRTTFYSQGADGFTDYPFADESTKVFVPPNRNAILLKREKEEKKLQNLHNQIIKDQYRKEVAGLGAKLGGAEDTLSLERSRMSSMQRKLEACEKIIAALKADAAERDIIKAKEKEEARIAQPRQMPEMRIDTAPKAPPEKLPFVNEKKSGWLCFSNNI